MEQDMMTVHPRQERMRSQQEQHGSPIAALLGGIQDTLRNTGTPLENVCCFALTALLAGARLPGGSYVCQSAMFAVLLRLGYCVPAAFAGVVFSFGLCYAMGSLLSCWQLPVCAMLWLSSGLWAGKKSRFALGGAVFMGLMSAAAIEGVRTPYAAMTLVLSALCGAGLSVMYLGAGLSVCRQDELDGETRPLCVMAVCASLIAGILPLPGGEVFSCALALYLTLEHAYVGGAQQAFLCAGVLGSAVSLGVGDVQVLAMLLCGGFLAGEVQVSNRWAASLLMGVGMAAAFALLGGEIERIRLFVFCLPGFVPFLVLSPTRRMGVTALIERTVSEELTQSEAIAVRSAAMIHAWAGLYRDTAQLMEGLTAGKEHAMVRECISLLNKTSIAAHQVCERTLSQIQPDDDAYKRIRYELVRAGMEQTRVVYALRVGGRMEVLLLKPEHIAPVSLQSVVTRACGVLMRPCAREGMLCTQAVFEQVPQLDVEIGAATRSRSGEEVTGDSYVSRALASGRHVLALSDGMGSGAQALEESHAALLLMVESLQAGYTREQAIEVVNQLMFMCMGREMYATMDLCVLDLHNAEAAFEKLGACASYVVRDGEARIVGADTLPVGVLPQVEAQSLRVPLQENDVIVMMTDGVADAYPGGEEALREAVGKLAWLHPQAVGERLIAKVLECGEAKDDMAVLCARVRRSLIA